RSSRGCSWPRRSRPTGRSPAGARRRRAAPTTAPPHPEVLPPPVRSLAAGRAGRPIARVRHAAVRSPGTLETGDPQDDSRSLCRHGCARLPARAARTHVRPAAGRAAPGRLARGRGPGAQGPARQYAGPAHASPGGRRGDLGVDGLAGAGISLYRAFGGLGTHGVPAHVTRSEPDGELFGGTGRPPYLLDLLNFWQLTRSTYMQLGGTPLYGTAPHSS